MTRKTATALCAMVLLAGAVQAARHPVLGGPGLVRLQSAKIGPAFGYRTLNLLTYYTDIGYLQDATLPGSSCLDAWSHQLASYSPHPDLAVLASLTGHGNKWTLGTQPAQPVDLTLGNAGDAVLAAKYHRSLLGGKLDLAGLPMVSIPLGKKGEHPDGTPIVVDRASNSGGFDVGAKVLADYDLGRMAVLANLGFLTRSGERAQLPLGAGLEYGFTQILSGFCELSGELRLGAVADAVPDALVPRGLGYDRSEFRAGGGVRLMPLPLLQVLVAAEAGLTRAAAPWHVILGVEIPASAGRVRGGTVLGAIAGRIKDRDSGVPMKGMITFPGADLPGTVSDDVGKYVKELPPGDYTIHIYANGYRWLQRKISVEQGKKLKWDLTLKRKLGTVTGRAADARTGAPLAATVRFAGTELPEIKADPATGEFTAVLPPAKYVMTIAAPGYKPREFTFPIKDRQVLEQPAALETDAVAVPQPPPAPVRTSPSPASQGAVPPPAPAKALPPADNDAAKPAPLPAPVSGQAKDAAKEPAPATAQPMPLPLPLPGGP